ncbi:low-density lipoprotein receptor class A domain-containing protein 4-like isoform X1 [Xyrichtys novacula]|uniref:Low-density lipoprotein receptor class A domain-containing protein 4-like isoform X1 n=1 Tax=Xyrichtys novacula TaxID=13765 RepID=A0AAV1FME5_XYRNO|nr:low-density lipoprotein receptor class A domain-containing protein 4-like isoform X1 [Xyrichtys novacula]
MHCSVLRVPRAEQGTAATGRRTQEDEERKLKEYGTSHISSSWQSAGRSSMQETDLPATNAFKECKFHCTNGNCLRLGSLICNQLNNCGDNSDEENCPVVTQHPPPGIFNSSAHTPLTPERHREREEERDGWRERRIQENGRIGKNIVRGTKSRGGVGKRSRRREESRERSCRRREGSRERSCRRRGESGGKAGGEGRAGKGAGGERSRRREESRERSCRRRGESGGKAGGEGRAGKGAGGERSRRREGSRERSRKREVRGAGGERGAGRGAGGEKTTEGERGRRRRAVSRERKEDGSAGRGAGDKGQRERRVERGAGGMQGEEQEKKSRERREEQEEAA